MTRVIGATCRLTSMGHELACGQGTAEHVARSGSSQLLTRAGNLLQPAAVYREAQTNPPSRQEEKKGHDAAAALH